MRRGGGCSLPQRPAHAMSQTHTAINTKVAVFRLCVGEGFGEELAGLAWAVLGSASCCGRKGSRVPEPGIVTAIKVELLILFLISRLRVVSSISHEVYNSLQLRLFLSIITYLEGFRGLIRYLEKCLLAFWILCFLPWYFSGQSSTDWRGNIRENIVFYQFSICHIWFH